MGVAAAAVGGFSLTSIDGYDSENLSACEMKPSEEAGRRAKGMKTRT